MMKENKKLIIVDDNAANLSVGRNMLKPYYEVFPAPSAAKLFSLLEKFMPDLILLDVKMPEMNGYEVIKILKADPRYADIPVIFLTAKNDEESELEGFNLGAVDYITKPFSGPLLLKRIACQLLLEQQKRDLFASRAALRDYADNLERMVREKTAAKTVFLANMSHELRSPMNSIVGFSELALGDVISERTESYLKRIMENSKWLLRIINEILDLTSYESGQIELEMSAFDIYEVVDECIAMFKAKTAENGLTLKFYPNPAVKRRLIGDPSRLQQVFINLLSNAVKFTKAGVVEFLMDVRSLSDDKATLFFQVSDTGIGIIPEQIEKIFDPFTQAESGSTRKYGGSGLGLTIASRIIELMGGRISVESIPLEGSKFSFELTFDVDKDDHVLNNIYSLLSKKKPVFEGTVLLCEDNLMNQQVACEFLAMVGLRVVVADNGKIALDIATERLKGSKKPFDLIFMDIHMPIMDGIETAQKLRELGINVPTIAMTANIMPDDVKKYIESGMDECLSKPFLSNELWSCLLRYLEPVNWQEHTVRQENDPDALKILDKLELLLKERNVDCLSLTYELQAIPGSEKMIEQIREFEFKNAAGSLKELRQDIMENRLYQ